MMTFDKGLIIDGYRGSICRFVNHSCEPNCRVDKWTVGEDVRVALFAGKNGIHAGEELTYDYNFAPFGENTQSCLCGSAKCRGILGPKKAESKLSRAAAAGTKLVKRGFRSVVGAGASGSEPSSKRRKTMSPKKSKKLVKTARPSTATATATATSAVKKKSAAASHGTPSATKVVPAAAAAAAASAAASHSSAMSRRERALRRSTSSTATLSRGAKKQAAVALLQSRRSSFPARRSAGQLVTPAPSPRSTDLRKSARPMKPSPKLKESQTRVGAVRGSSSSSSSSSSSTATPMQKGMAKTSSSTATPPIQKAMAKKKASPTEKMPLIPKAAVGSGSKSKKVSSLSQRLSLRAEETNKWEVPDSDDDEDEEDDDDDDEDGEPRRSGRMAKPSPKVTANLKAQRQQQKQQHRRGVSQTGIGGGGGGGAVIRRALSKAAARAAAFATGKRKS
jgi:hypothetical protein